MNSWFALAAVLALIALNALFVAAEFGYVAVRRGVIEEAAEAGDARAVAVGEQLKTLTFVLSVAQFGITASSLVVGFLADRAFGETILAPLVEAIGLPASSRTSVAVGGAFVLSTGLQMVLGELVPKNAAIAKPEATALRVARPMRLVARTVGPLVRLFDAAAAWITRTLFRTEVVEELSTAMSLEDLDRVIAASSSSGTLTAGQSALLTRAVELGDTRVSEVLTPWADVHTLRADQTLSDVVAASVRTGFSRFPVLAGDRVIGTAHIKDALYDRPDRPLGAGVAPPLFVPERETLRRLLARLREGGRSLGIVLDEHGEVVGVVTVEDVLEVLVGDIVDEHDRPVSMIRPLGPGRWLAAGSLRLDRLAEEVGLELPEGEYDTLAGFLLDRSGRILEVGDVVTYDGWTLVVRHRRGLRLTRIEVQQ